jgi:hypothetical protein
MDGTYTNVDAVRVVGTEELPFGHLTDPLVLNRFEHMLFKFDLCNHVF